MEEKIRYATKKTGKTEGYPFWDMSHIKGIMDYFKSNELWNEYLTFMFLFLFGRRVGDTLDMVWSDIFYENGNIKDEIRTIEEQKTGKTSIIYVSPYAKQVIREYLNKTGRNPMENLNDYIFPFNLKYIWRNDKDNRFYTEIESLHFTDDDAMNFLNDYCANFNKDWGNKRKLSIIEEWNKKRHKFHTLGKFLYYEVVFSDISKWQVGEFRKVFDKAVSTCNIPYKVTVHSVRKSFGYYTRILHPYDVNCMETLQDIFGHSDVKTTMHYIGLSSEKKMQYFNDIGEMALNISEGNYDLKRNSPVVTLKEQDLRMVLMAAMEQTDEDKANKLNRLLDMVGEMKVV